MASIFGHALASTTLGKSFFNKFSDKKALWLAAACAAVPDADIIAFNFGIPYSSIWGHRGFTHSLFFALVWGLLIAWLFYRNKSNFKAMVALFALSTASHPLLDMLTNGGRGVALWFPFSYERIFFPFRPIQVSPISPSDFFGTWGLQVLFSELYWIGGLCLVVYLLSWAVRFFRK